MGQLQRECAMVTIVNLPVPALASKWKMAFADSVIELCPELNPDAADEAADVAITALRDVDPARAAAQWVRRRGLQEDLPAEDAGSAANGPRWAR